MFDPAEQVCPPTNKPVPEVFWPGQVWEWASPYEAPKTKIFRVDRIEGDRLIMTMADGSGERPYNIFVKYFALMNGRMRLRSAAAFPSALFLTN